MKLKSILLTGIIAVAGLSLAACSSSASSKTNEVDKIKKAGVIKVALSPDYPPFEYQTIKNGKNQVVGSDIELANAIGQKLGVKVQIETMDFNNVLASLTSGQADIAISGISATPEREKTYDFSDVYYNATNLVVVKKSDLNKYTSVNDFKNEPVAAQKGTIQEQAVTSMFKGASLVSLPTTGDEINEVQEGQVKAAVIENLIAKSYVAQNPSLAIANIDANDAQEKSVGDAVALNKNEADLKNVINGVIKDWKDSGKMDKVIQSNYAESQKSAK